MMPVISVSWNRVSFVWSAVPSGPGAEPSPPPSRENAPFGVELSTLRTRRSKGWLGFSTQRTLSSSDHSLPAGSEVGRSEVSTSFAPR